MTSGHASEMDFFPGSGLSPATPISFTLENGKKEKQNLSAVREGGRYHFSIPFPASGEYRVVAESAEEEIRRFVLVKDRIREESIFPLWNRAWIYLLIVGLILLEYWIRRRYGKLV